MPLWQTLLPATCAQIGGTVAHKGPRCPECPIGDLPPLHDTGCRIALRVLDGIGELGEGLAGRSPSLDNKLPWIVRIVDPASDIRHGPAAPAPDHYNSRCIQGAAGAHRPAV